MQPYEAHIPYLLQFTSDYNISPMGWLHLAKCEVSICIHCAVVCARDQHTSSHRMQPRRGAEDQLRLHAVKTKASHGIAASLSGSGIDGEDPSQLLSSLPSDSHVGGSQPPSQPVDLMSQHQFQLFGPLSERALIDERGCREAAGGCGGGDCPPLLDSPSPVDQRESTSPSHGGLLSTQEKQLVLELLEGITEEQLNWTPEQESAVHVAAGGESAHCTHGIPIVKEKTSSCEIEIDVDHVYIINKGMSKQRFGEELWQEERMRCATKGVRFEGDPDPPSTQTAHREVQQTEVDFARRLDNLKLKGGVLRTGLGLGSVRGRASSVGVDDGQVLAESASEFKSRIDQGGPSSLNRHDSELDPSSNNEEVDLWVVHRIMEVESQAAVDLLQTSRYQTQEASEQIHCDSELFVQTTILAGEECYRSDGNVIVCDNSDDELLLEEDGLSASEVSQEVEDILSSTQMGMGLDDVCVQMGMEIDVAHARFSTAVKEANRGIDSHLSSAEKSDSSSIDGLLDFSYAIMQRRRESPVVGSSPVDEVAAKQNTPAVLGSADSCSSRTKTNPRSLSSVFRKRRHDDDRVPKMLPLSPYVTGTMSPQDYLDSLYLYQQPKKAKHRVSFRDSMADIDSVGPERNSVGTNSVGSECDREQGVVEEAFDESRSSISRPASTGVIYLIPAFRAPSQGQLSSMSSYRQPDIINHGAKCSNISDATRTSDDTSGGSRALHTVPFINNCPVFDGGFARLNANSSTTCQSVIFRQRCLVPTFKPPPPLKFQKEPCRVIRGGAAQSTSKTTLESKSQMYSPTQTPHSSDVNDDAMTNNIGAASVAVKFMTRLTSFSLEIHCNARLELLPNPKYDAVQAIFWMVDDCISNAESESVKRMSGFIMQRDQPPTHSRSIITSAFGLPADCFIEAVDSELQLFTAIIRVIGTVDPDFLVGYRLSHELSFGYLMRRAACLGINLPRALSRVPNESEPSFPRDPQLAPDDEGGDWADNDIHVTGRIVLELWRIMKSELKLFNYTYSNVAAHVLSLRVPCFSPCQLTKWFVAPTTKHRTVTHMAALTRLNLDLLDKVDLVRKVSESARLYGIDFNSVLTRGSQYRVEAALLSQAHAGGYLLISPSRRKVAAQAPMEVIPLVMEPRTQLYTDPIIVLDFQSLYPSMILAHNLCFSTIMGKLRTGVSGSIDTTERLGVVQYPETVSALNATISSSTDTIRPYISPNGSVFCNESVRAGILPAMVKEMLSTRVMVKKAMKQYSTVRTGERNKILSKVLDARQLAIKLLSNVTCKNDPSIIIHPSIMILQLSSIHPSRPFNYHPSIHMILQLLSILPSRPFNRS